MIHNPIGERLITDPALFDPASSDLAILTDRLSCGYGKQQVIDRVSLHVRRGTVYGFLGVNGSGKTTTIKTLLGLQRPHAGGGWVLGYDVVAQSLEVRKHVSYVAETNNLYSYMRVSEMVETARRLSTRWNAPNVARYLDLFGLSPRTKIRTLSKGMKGQLALALALGNEPEVLILDEPTSGLDPLKRYDFLNYIVREVVAAGRTIFFSSHNLGEVEQIADWVAILHDGRLMLEEELDTLKLYQKAIKASFDQPIWTHDLEEIPGVRQVVQEGRRFRLLVRGNVEQVAAAVMALGARHVEVVDMNLEAIFVSYVRSNDYVEGNNAL